MNHNQDEHRSTHDGGHGLFALGAGGKRRASIHARYVTGRGRQYSLAVGDQARDFQFHLSVVAFFDDLPLTNCRGFGPGLFHSHCNEGMTSLHRRRARPKLPRKLVAAKFSCAGSKAHRQRVRKLLPGALAAVHLAVGQ